VATRAAAARPTPKRTKDVSVGELGGLLIPLLFLVVLWFLLIRPQQKRQKEHLALVRSLQVGDDVITLSGLHGEVVALTDDTVDLAVTGDSDVVVRFQRQSVGKVVRDEPEVQ
jgi:preprotein translocase subunit YajC